MLYPATDLDRPEVLTGLLGTFWADTYQGDAVSNAVLAARALLEQQVVEDFDALLNSISRYTVPVFRTEAWQLLTFRESEVNTFRVLPSRYGTARNYGDSLHYGDAAASTLFAVPCPADLKDCRLIFNRLTEPSLVWAAGIDFTLPAEGVLAFRENPFNDPLVPVQSIFRDGQQVDREAGLWLFRGKFDDERVWRQFGYSLRVHLQSSVAYRNLVNAILDAGRDGTTQKTLQTVLATLTGIPLADADETVEMVEQDARALRIATDQNFYSFPLGSAALVKPGDQLVPGQAMVDTVQLYEPGQGEPPFTSLTIGPGLLADGYYGELTFPDEDVAIAVTTESGRSKVSWQLGGFPGDVEHFWDDVHQKGIQAGKTLAQLLDRRSNPVGEPSAASLPPSISPLRFLLDNYLRYHAFVVKIKVNRLGTAAVGLWAASLLRHIVPPEKVLLFIMELEHSSTLDIMERVGSQTGMPCGVVRSQVASLSTASGIRSIQTKGRCV